MQIRVLAPEQATSQDTTNVDIANEVIKLNKEVCNALCSSVLVTSAYFKWLSFKKDASILLADLLLDLSSDSEEANSDAVLILKNKSLDCLISDMNTHFKKFDASYKTTSDNLFYIDKKIHALEKTFSSEHSALSSQFNHAKSMSESIKHNLLIRAHVYKEHQDIVDEYTRLKNPIALKPSCVSIFHKSKAISAPLNGHSTMEQADDMPLSKVGSNKKSHLKSCAIF